MTISDRIAEHGRWLSGETGLSAELHTKASSRPWDLTDAEQEAVKAAQAAAPNRLICANEDLSGLDLQDAVLRLSDLRGADLRNSDLRRVDLRGADLRDAQIEGVNFVGAVLDAGTKLTGIDLGAGLANRSSTGVLLTALGEDPNDVQERALANEVRSLTGVG